MEPGVQEPEETLKLRSGSCRDSGWLLVNILRHLGLASRFVSGYLIQLVADVKSLDGPSGAERDFTDLHAWTEVYLPGAGWVGLDPTSGLLAGEGHIPLACTPHPVSAAPITGALEEAETKFEHAMSVQRIVESPRVTKPYSEEQWHAVDAFGRRVEQQLSADDVRVTIGGEPTFVAMDDADAPEWNTAATGPTKRRFAADLIHRLRARFAPRGLLHYGQGKWYPGEQLPRWAFSLYWRRDGKDLWRADKLIAEEANDYGVTADHARGALGRRGVALGARPRGGDRGVRGSVAFHRPGTEAARESRRGHESARRSDGARAARARVRAGLGQARRLRLARAALERGGLADAPLGQRTVDDARGQAVSRARRLAARVPPAVAVARSHLPPAQYPHVVPADPFVEHEPLPDPHPERQPFLQGERRGERRQDRRTQRTAPGRPARTAVAVEPRDGHLCVFMPPVAELEDYLDLLAAVEDASAELELADSPRRLRAAARPAA